MSKTDGIGVLSLSLEFLHVMRWPRASEPHAPQPPGGTPTVFVAVNFDDPAPLEADVTELPGGDVSRRADLAARAGLWHGLRLTSMRDILHVEVRLRGPSSPSPCSTVAVGQKDEKDRRPIASFSGPVTSFLEEAFLESDARGARATFELGSSWAEAAAERPAATAQFRVKFHLQADILRALCDGVEIETAFVDSIKAFAPRHLVPLCGAALTLAVARRRSLSGGDGRESERNESFDAKAAAQEREESAAFRRRARARDGAREGVAERAERALDRSYAALTAGVKRFIASKRADDRAAESHESNLVRLLTDAG